MCPWILFSPTGDGSGVPNWKADIENRKKTKNHVPDHKPKEPMKMFEVPEWKRQLQDKKKTKKMNASNEETELSLSKVRETHLHFAGPQRL